MDEIRFQIIDILTDDISLNEDNEEFELDNVDCENE